MKASKDVMRTAKTLFRASFRKGKLDDDLVRSVIKRLREQKPRNYFKIASVYHHLVRLELVSRQATVESADALDDTMKERIIADLKKKYGDELTADFATNAELLGGIRVRVGSDVWDGSVRNRLERLQNALS